jgi:microcystin-dependent protein
VANPYLGEIRLFSFGYTPTGWAQCNGQILPISTYPALFSLLGTTYGGNGVQTFALPNLQGRVALFQGSSAWGSFTIGQLAGEEVHTLQAPEMATHNHFQAGTAATAGTDSPVGSVLATVTGAGPYAAGTPNTNLASAALQATGGGQPHENRQPYLVLNACIALVGIFPSRN